MRGHHLSDISDHHIIVDIVDISARPSSSADAGCACRSRGLICSVITGCQLRVQASMGEIESAGNYKRMHDGDSDEVDSSRRNVKSSKTVGAKHDTGSRSAVVKQENAASVLGKEGVRLLTEKGFCIAPFVHGGVSAAVTELLKEGGPADIFFSTDSATALFAAEVNEEKKKKGGSIRQGYWQAGPRRAVMRIAIGQEPPGAEAMEQAVGMGGYKAAASRAVAQHMKVAMQRAEEAMRGMAEGALQEVAREVEGDGVRHLVETYGKGGSDVQAIVTVSLVSGVVEAGKEGVADCGVHTDRGLLTVVCSREGGGLFIQGNVNEFFPWTAAEERDKVTVLGGHVLERVSLGKIKAAPHAVFTRGGERMSVALTLRPAKGGRVRVDGVTIPAEDVMGELFVSVNEPESRGEGKDQDQGWESRKQPDRTVVCEFGVGEQKTINITFHQYIGGGPPVVTFTNVARTTKLGKLWSLYANHSGLHEEELGDKYRFLAEKTGRRLSVGLRSSEQVGSVQEFAHCFDSNECESEIDVFQMQIGD